MAESSLNQLSNQIAQAPSVAQRTAAPVRALVFGARGYSGLELIRLLLAHPQAELAGCFATSAFDVGTLLPDPAARSLRALPTEDGLSAAKSEGATLAFLATPMEASARLAPGLLELGLDVIDLSGAFRLKADGEAGSAALYREWYACAEHPSLRLAQKARYGLMPFAAQARSAESSEPCLVANPGCFATAALLAVAPLLKEGLIEADSIAIDGKSGSTGAGRKAEERLLHAEVRDGCLAYKPGRHQHEPEIREALRAISGRDAEFSFVPHLLDLRRGLVVSVHARAADPSLAPEEIEAQAQAAYESAFQGDPLIEAAPLAAEGSSPLLSLKRVVGSARAQIAHSASRGRIYSFCLIDNLMKGAASQAIENMNRLRGIPSWTGLLNAQGAL